LFAKSFLIGGEEMESLELHLDKFTLKVPQDRLYSKEDLWVKISANAVEIGITDFLQTKLGDILFFTLESKSDLKRDQPLGTIESIKATLEIISPISGRVIAVNDTLDQNAEFLTQDPYGRGWIIKVEPSEWEAEQEKLLTPEAYFAWMQGNAQKAIKT
jgi:glycine cleavage system H protein